MPDNTLSLLQRIEEYGLIGYTWILIVVLWGSTARYLGSLNGKKATFLGWLTETIICAFVGVIAGMVCQFYSLDILLTAAISGIAAHNGTRSLYFITQIIKRNAQPIDITEMDKTDIPQSLTKKKEDPNSK